MSQGLIEPIDPVNQATARIRALNDQLRTSTDFLGVLMARGQLVITRGVAARGSVFISRARTAVRTYTDFTSDNDPWGEHDFGDFTLDGVKLFWKIDYYDDRLEKGSEDPSDPAQTRRVLTILLADEY
jgi:uncharacterized protein DUF3768